MSDTIASEVATAEDTIARQVADRAEAARVRDHRQAIDILRKIAAPLEPPDPAIVVVSKAHQLAVVYARQWQEFEVEADRALREGLVRLMDAYVEARR